jgi:hypothetical protein
MPGRSRSAAAICSSSSTRKPLTPGLDDLARRTLGERDDRRPAGQRLDHDEPERLLPADRHQQAPGAGEQVPLALALHLARRG